jgi:hypothetical protein
MSPRVTMMPLLIAASSTGCQCANGDIVELDSDVASSIASESTTEASGTGTGGTSTGAPIDASRWIGRYHFESPWVPFGEREEHLGVDTLMNFEILGDFRATMFYEDCSSEDPVITIYEWVPSEEGWLSLHPGPGESSLQIWGNPNVATLRVQMIDPCRELHFELDGQTQDWMPFRPGESCWVDRCTTPGIMQVDYCAGEEPPACP